MAPQVLAEFIHVVTDERRFAVPLSVEAAVERASSWWRAEEVLPIYPNAETSQLFLRWLRQFRLGRKRLLDALLAATWHEAGVLQILTLDWPHFQLYGCFNTEFSERNVQRLAWAGISYKHPLGCVEQNTPAVEADLAPPGPVRSAPERRTPNAER